MKGVMLLSQSNKESSGGRLFQTDRFSIVTSSLLSDLDNNIIRLSECESVQEADVLSRLYVAGSIHDGSEKGDYNFGFLKDYVVSKMLFRQPVRRERSKETIECIKAVQSAGVEGVDDLTEIRNKGVKDRLSGLFRRRT